jgi:hypothetical protein
MPSFLNGQDQIDGDDFCRVMSPPGWNKYEEKLRRDWTKLVVGIFYETARVTYLWPKMVHPDHHMTLQRNYEICYFIRLLLYGILDTVFQFELDNDQIRKSTQ